MYNDEIEIELPDTDPLSIGDVSEAVLNKALALIEANRPTIDGHETITAEVIGSSGEKYRILMGLNSDSMPTWTSCSCPWGQRNQTGKMGCSHQVAAFLEYCRNT